MMTGRDLDKFHRIEAIFDAAVEYPPGAWREAFLKEQCADQEMAEEVRQLLDDHERVRAAAPEPAESLPQFGAWRAIRLLGRGGMGTVYLAERADGAFRMSAAVKVVPLALASVDIEERFRRERQFLASLDHPKVARLIDGGVTNSGLPYLVMEFVDGLTIERYCEANNLDSRARIALMRQVLDALQYVHGRGVIHRDLKPSNILVDAAGNAKLLDFGTARLVDASGDTAITKTGVFAFTPECASPEQVQGKPLTFASDIYSLGVLLYRLLTGRPPYRFDDYSPASIADRINRTEPEPSGLDKPLDAILLTALNSNPEKRYASAADMDADLARYLDGQPVHARKPRNFRMLAIAAAAILLCAVAIWMFFDRRAGSASIAVLPFTNQTSEAATRYLSKGLTDDLTDSLSRLKTLRVITSESVARYSGTLQDSRQAGRELNVANVVEGTVYREGGRIKIAARLRRVSDGAVLWSNAYERPESDLPNLQSEMAAKIAGTLGVKANPASKHIPDAQAHDYAMKGRYELQQLTTESLERAKEDFQRAIELDPQYAYGYFGLGTAEFNESAARGSNYQTDQERSSARTLLAKSAELDASAPGPHGLIAMMDMQYDWNWKAAERELQMGEAGGFNSNVEMGYASLLLFHGRFADADKHILRMQELDPFQTSTMANIAAFRTLEGRTGESRLILTRLTDAYPKMIAAKLLLYGCDIWDGRTDVALGEIREWKKSFPAAQMFEAMAQARAGNRDEALRLIQPFEEKYPNPGVAMQWFALTYALLGDEPNTVKWLGRSADRREWQVLNMGINPVYAAMRNSPDFRALEKRIGLLE